MFLGRTGECRICRVEGTFLTITIYLPSIIIDDAEEGQEASESYHVAEYLGLQHLPEPSSFTYFWRTNEE